MMGIAEYVQCQKGVVQSSMTAKRFRPVLFLLMGFVIAALGGYVYLLHGTPASPETLMIRQISLDQGRLQLSGTTSSSAAGYSGYSYTIEDGKLYVRLRYSLLNSSGDFAIDMPTKEATIRNVYLQGSSSDDVRLLWSE